MSLDFQAELQKALDNLDGDHALRLIDAAILEAKETKRTLEDLREKTAPLFGRI